ncbi:MAG: OmpA family protein [Dermatophilus congolensis]|nr:OmpA family protein [Dermatophilus congolensis]
MTRHLTAALLAAALLGAQSSAALGDSRATPGTPIVPPEGTTYVVQDISYPVDDIVFGEANADGSVVHQSNEITMLADVFFAHDESALNARATQEVAGFPELLKQAGASEVTITGHTDSDGADTYNLDLSKRRAESVKAALASALPGVTMTATGKGETSPVADNATKEGKALNRRVTITWK